MAVSGGLLGPGHQQHRLPRGGENDHGQGIRRYRLGQPALGGRCDRHRIPTRHRIPPAGSACIAGDLYAVKVTVRRSSGALVAAPTTTTPKAVCDGSSPPPAATTGGISHVVLIVEENHPSSSVTASSMPYLTSLASRFAHAADYTAITHPSEPNYMALTSGVASPTTDCTPSASCNSTADNIFHQLGDSWRVYAETIPSACAKSNTGAYAVRHTAAPYYTDIPQAECAANDIPLPTTLP